MALALFDLDNTLLAGDSDYLWGVFLGEKGIVDPDYYRRENERFYEEYKQGRLDIMEFLDFSLRPLAENDPEQLRAWREEFLREKIEPLITEDACLLVDMHRKRRLRHRSHRAPLRHPQSHRHRTRARGGALHRQAGRYPLLS